MKRQDIVIGIVILAIVGGFLYTRSQQESSTTVPDTQTTSTTTEKELEDRFKIDLPDGSPKAELTDVEGGDGSGIASYKVEGGSYTLTVLADLSAPDQGASYQGWIVRGNEGEDNYSKVLAGRLTSAKGGYLLSFQSQTDYSDHKTVIISQEKNSDTVIDSKVLEGSF